MRHRKLERAIAMFGSFLYGCTGVVEPPLPVGAVPMEAAPQFALWWRLTERCAGRTGDLASISWYVVPGADNLGSSDIQGEYTSGKRRIVLAGHWADDPLLVRHE